MFARNGDASGGGTDAQRVVGVKMMTRLRMHGGDADQAVVVGDEAGHEEGQV